MAVNFKRKRSSDFDFGGAPIYRKTSTLAKSQVKIATKREEVVTTVGAVEETRNVARPGDRIVTGPRGERYVIKAAAFAKLYELDGGRPARYRSKTRVRALELAENTELKAPWGEWQRALKGGAIVQRVGKPSEIYLIDRKVFADTYAPDQASAKRAVNKA